LPKLEQVLFNVSSAAVAIWVAYYAFHGPLHTRLHQSTPLLLMVSAGVYFLFNTLPVATIISLTENKSLRKVWTDCYFWSLPYYLAGGAIAGMIGWINQRVGWQATLLGLPAMFVIYRSYRLYLGKLENEKNHVAEMAALHLRTIEALADYKKAIADAAGLAELMVFYCEEAAGFSSDLGYQDESYFDALVRMFNQAVATANRLPVGSRDALIVRLDRVRSISHKLGYGVGDDMDSIFAKYTKRKA